MVEKVIWTLKAELSFERVLSFLKEDWSARVADGFAGVVQSKIELLRSYPMAGFASGRKKGYRRILLSKHNSLYYRIKDDSIVILNIQDNRQDLKRIAK